MIGSRLKGPARRLYIRANPSTWGQYDPQTLAIFKKHLKHDSNCIDIGAHRGSMLREIIARAPEGKHYAFESLPEHTRYLAMSNYNIQSEAVYDLITKECGLHISLLPAWLKG